MPAEKYKRVLVIAFYIIAFALFAYVFFRYLLRLFLPFIIAWIVSMAIRPMVEVLHRRTKIPKKILSIVLVLFLLASIGWLLFALTDRLVYELRGIVAYFNENSDELIGRILDLVNGVLNRIPFLKKIGSEEEMLAGIERIGRDMFSGFTEKVPEMLTKTISALPGAMFVSLILVTASYYFCADYVEIAAFFRRILPKKIIERSARIKEKVKRTGSGILKGYLMTVGITFLQLYIGFLIIKVDYSFAAALLIAVVDVLPVIGVGTVLIPWAGLKLLYGAYYQGFGLLIIFAVVSVVREIVDPKIIGKSIGLHPLATLFSMYIGLELCGFIGLISFPVLAMAAKTAMTNLRKE